MMDALHAQAGRTAFQALPPKKPGLDELIAYLEKAQHIPMVVGSSSRMASILHHLTTGR